LTFVQGFPDGIMASTLVTFRAVDPSPPDEDNYAERYAHEEFEHEEFEAW
jgi:hypothetical protein